MLKKIQSGRSSNLIALGHDGAADVIHFFPMNVQGMHKGKLPEKICTYTDNTFFSISAPTKDAMFTVLGKGYVGNMSFLPRTNLHHTNGLRVAAGGRVM